MPDFQFVTPALLVNETTVAANQAKLKTYAAENNFEVRSHIKTHRSTHFTDLSRESFGPRLAVARASEARLLHLGTDVDVLFTRPPCYSGAENDLLELAQSGQRTYCCDSPEQIAVLQRVAQITDRCLPVAILLDVGAGREGVESPSECKSILEEIKNSDALHFWGLVAYGGHLYGPAAHDSSAMIQVADRIRQFKSVVDQVGFESFELSYGSTPTVCRSHELESITEIRPGNFFFNDLTLLELGHCLPSECAVTVQTSVLSRRGDTLIVDAGSKSLSGRQYTDQHGPIFGRILELPKSRFFKVNEEHGFIDVSGCASVPRVGSTLSILPVHAALTMNNFRRFISHADGQLRGYFNIEAANAE